MRERNFDNSERVCAGGEIREEEEREACAF